MEVGFLAWPVIPGIPAQQLVKTVAATGVPEQISNVSLRVRYATIIGRKTTRVDNTGVVHVGPTGTDDAQGYDIQPGMPSAAMDAQLAGAYIDLAQWYVDVENAGDGVLVIYDR